MGNGEVSEDWPVWLGDGTQSSHYLLLDTEVFQYFNTAMACAFSRMLQPYGGGLGYIRQSTERPWAAVLRQG